MWQKKRSKTSQICLCLGAGYFLRYILALGDCWQGPKSYQHCQTFTQQWNHVRSALMSVRTGSGFPTVYLCQPDNRTVCWAPALLAALRLPPNTCEQWLPPHVAAKTMFSFFWYQSTSFSSWRHDSLWATWLKLHNILAQILSPHLFLLF